MEKRYPFSTKKHAHDVNYRYDKCKNEIAQLQEMGKDTSKHEKLAEQLSSLIDCFSGMCDQVVWLTGKQYGLAMDCVCWATAMRKS